MSHPAQIVADAVAALNRDDWDAFVSLCDPVSVRRFKRDLVWQFADRGYTQPPTVDDFLAEMPDMPRGVAEYNLAEMERYRDPVKRLHLEICTVSSVEELQALEPGEVLLRWLQARMPRRENDFSVKDWEPADGLEFVEFTRQSQDELDSGRMFRPEYTVLGSVRDGPDFAHVVCRHTHGDSEEFSDDIELEDPAIPQDEAKLERALRLRSLMLTAACRRQADGSWRLVADRNLFFLANMSVANPEVEPD
jgi:hypothetical protein